MLRTSAVLILCSAFAFAQDFGGPARNPPIQLGHALAALKQYDDAVVQLRLALDEFPSNLEYRSEIAHTPALSGKQEEALTAFRELVKDQPDSPIAHADLGVELLAMSQTEEAGKELQKAVELDAKSARAHFYLGRLREKTGAAAGAQPAYEMARSLEPDNEEFRPEAPDKP